MKNKQKFKKLFGEELYNSEKITYKLVAVPNKNKMISFIKKIVPYSPIEYSMEKNSKYNLFFSESFKKYDFNHIRKTHIYDYEFPEDILTFNGKNI